MTGGEEKIGESMHTLSLKSVVDLKGVDGGDARVGVRGRPDSSNATLPLRSNLIMSNVI